MRSLRTIAAPLALGLAVLAVAGCQRPADPPGGAAPPQVQRVTATSAPAAKPAPPAPRPPATRPPGPAPAPDTVIGLWPVTTLQQAREIQDGADAGHQPWLLSPERVAVSYAASELGLYQPVARRVGPSTYQVGATGSEWAATLRLAQPVRQGPGGVWVVTRIG
jgi:hypothetical protein